jgi:hypothetical protein
MGTRVWKVDIADAKSAYPVGIFTVIADNYRDAAEEALRQAAKRAKYDQALYVASVVADCLVDGEVTKRRRAK